MTIEAIATVAHLDADRAIMGLRGQLRLLAAQDGAWPDWSTLRITGPGEVLDASGVPWYEWLATVDARPLPAHES